MRLLRLTKRQVDRFPSPKLPAAVTATRVSVHPILSLQRTIGNWEVQRLLNSRRLQAKLTVSRPADQYQQEAEHVANLVMGVAPDAVQRNCACGGTGADEREECRKKPVELLSSLTSVQREYKDDRNIEEAQPVIEQVLRSPGHPLDTSTRSFMESRFDHDFSNVRVHSDAQAASSARAVDALGYTVGQHVVFGAGQYAPSTTAGKKLLAHELTHVIQQSDHRAERLQRQVSPASAHLQSPRFSPSAKLERCFEDTDRLVEGDPDTDAVKRIQQALIDVQQITGNTYELGSTGPNNDGVDGDYGPKTAAGVKKFKADENLGFTQFGDVGPGTTHRLDELFSAEPTPPAPTPPAPSSPEPIPSGPSPTPASPTPPTPTPPKRTPVSGCPPYTRSELENSAKSRGQAERLSRTLALVFDFIPGQDKAREVHTSFLSELVEQLGLKASQPKARVSLIEGHTDCVEREELNFAIRARRAETVAKVFSELGARPENIGKTAPAVTGELPGNDADPTSRARNRSVRIEIASRPTPAPQQPNPPRLCFFSLDVTSNKWALRPDESVFIVIGSGRIAINFTLKNLGQIGIDFATNEPILSECLYHGEFRGTAKGIAAGFKVSVPGGEFKEFGVPKFIHQKELTGAGANYRNSILGGSIRLPNFDTSPSRIAVGGLTGQDALKLGLIVADGEFLVFDNEHA